MTFALNFLNLECPCIVGLQFRSVRGQRFQSTVGQGSQDSLIIDGFFLPPHLDHLCFHCVSANPQLIRLGWSPLHLPLRDQKHGH